LINRGLIDQSVTALVHTDQRLTMQSVWASHLTGHRTMLCDRQSSTYYEVCLSYHRTRDSLASYVWLQHWLVVT